MSIVKMSKIKLISLYDYKEDILNALHKTASVELTATEEVADTFTVQKNEENLPIYQEFDRIKGVITFFEERLEKCKNKPFLKEDLSFLKYQFLTYEEFVSAKDKKEQVGKIVEKISTYRNKVMENRAAALKLNNILSQLNPYLVVKEKFSEFKSTKTTHVFFGTIKAEAISSLQNFVEENPLSELKVLAVGQQAVIALVVFNDLYESAEQKLVENGFNKCPFDFDKTPTEKTKEIESQLNALDNDNEQVDKLLCQSVSDLKELRAYSDYLKFVIEKEKVSEEFRRTNKTFVMQGYLPEESKQTVLDTIHSVTKAVFIEFSEPTKQDTPPTLLKNKSPIKQSEFVVDMYSSPNYRELDPNKVVFIFFMLFMGLIMADIGYGLCMMFIGIYLSSKIKIDNGAKRLWSIIAFSGIPTIIFGVLFNSLFGFALPYKAILPNPVPDGSGMNNLMLILLMCLGLGVLHMAVGYLCKAINMFKQRDILGGI
ncbi:MAG: hypothetical protein E7382_05540, partial [Clostridiales bacterium]|nr:hypothetical protein [Clostridiales bacterium]